MKECLTFWQVMKDGVFYDDDWGGQQCGVGDDGMMQPKTRQSMEAAAEVGKGTRRLNGPDDLFEVLKAKVEVNSTASTTTAASFLLKFFPGRYCRGSTDIRAAARCDAVARRYAAACNRGGRGHVFTRADVAGCGSS